jgi:hydrogenase-4 component B
MTFLALPRSPEAAAAQEVGRPMRMAMTALALACVAAGFLATPLTDGMRGVAQVAVAGAGATPQAVAGAGATPQAAAGPISPVSGPDYGAAVLAVVLVVAVAITWAVVRRREARARRTLTWTCGVLPEPAFEYTATSFEKPARLFYEPIYRAQRELDVELHPGTPFPRRIEYHTAVDDALESRVYGPTHRFSIRLAQVVRKLQHGSLQLYLFYIVAAVVVLLLVNR